jgi:ferredoxin
MSAGHESDPPDVEVSPSTCLGTGLCTFYAPGTFDLDDDGQVMLLDTGAEGTDSPADIANAAEACPTGSIRLRRSASR